MNSPLIRSLVIVGVVALALLGVTQVVLAADGPPILVSTAAAGMTEDGLSYGREDILTRYDGAWYMAFDGSEYGLRPTRHNINAVAVPWEIGFYWELTDTLPVALLSFSTPRTSVPDIPVYVFPQDIVMFYRYPDRAAGGAAFSMTVDGSDIGLNLASEAIDGLSYFSMPEYISDTIYFDYPCPYGFFAISTQGYYNVPTRADGLPGPREYLRGSGSDILLFCPSQLGYTTRGYWFKLFDSFEAGITPPHAIDSIALLYLSDEPPIRANPDELEYHADWLQTSKRPYTAPGFAADISQVVYGSMYNDLSDQYSMFGMEWDLNGSYPRLNGKVDALDTLMVAR